MAYERFTLETVDGEMDVPKTDLVSLEVELDTELASMFRLRLAIRQQRDGSWTYLDEERFRPWMPMRITGGFDTGTEELLSGYITHVKPDFSAQRRAMQSGNLGYGPERADGPGGAVIRLAQ